MEKVQLNLYQRLNEAMKLIENVPKNGMNKHQNYSFATHDDVTAVTRNALMKVGVKAIPSDLERFREPGGNTTILKMSVDFINIDNPEDHREIISYGEGTDTQDKGIGKAKSYALKYAYLKILGLSTGLDPEEDSIDRKVSNGNGKITPKVSSGNGDKNKEEDYLKKNNLIAEIKMLIEERHTEEQFDEYLKKQNVVLTDSSISFLEGLLNKIKLSK